MMDNYSKPITVTICFIGILFYAFPTSTALNVPCQSRAGDEGQGQICVCNSTYCDTIERPARLPLGHYYLYTTSNSTPGFSQTNGTFSADRVGDEDDIVFSINSSVLYQDIMGFGGAFTDAVGMVLNAVPEDVRSKIIESYFGPTGIEYTLGRVPIGSSDFSTHVYSMDEVPYDYDLLQFNLTYEDINLKIPYIKQAQKVSTHNMKFYGCAWTPPTWMKDNDNITADYIRSVYLPIWAKYHVKFLQSYKDSGVDIWAISGGNEVLSPFLYKQIIGAILGFLATVPTQRYWLKEYLSPQLEAANFSHVKYLALDDERFFAKYWMDGMVNDPEALQLVDGIALHWYGDWVSPPTILDDFHQSYPDKLIVYTESSINYFMFDGKPVELGSWERAAVYIYNIMENFNHYTNGYMDWNIVLNTDGGPYTKLPLEAAIIVNETNGEFYKQPIFYGIGHFSKFMPPGSRRVEVTSNQNESSSWSEDLQHAKPRKNSSHPHYSARPIPLSSSSSTERLADHLSKFPPTHIKARPVVMCLATANSDDSHTAIVFNSKNVTVRVRVENPMVGSVSLDVEAYSINSFVYWLR